MSRYDWPAARGAEEDDDPSGRVAFLRRHFADFDPLGAQRRARGAAGPAAAPGVLRAPVSGRAHLWQPLGPDTVVDGQAIGQTRVAGRVNMLAVHPDGERVYAATANGGAWYSGNGGVSWQSLGGLASTPTPGLVNRPAQRHACGSIAVDWGTTAAGDVVYLGTGETTHARNAQPGNSLGGIGILRGEHPATAAGPDPWVREAPHLLGQGVCRIALQPGGSGVVAATTAGLFERPAAATADSPWTRVASAPFATLQDKCADVLWTRGNGTRPERLWVWVQFGAHVGLWVRAAGGGFQRILAPPQVGAVRAVLAAADPAVSPDQIYVFADHGGTGVLRLFRVACPDAAKPVATPVFGVPNILQQIGFYAIALAVHPTRKDHVVVGGKSFAAVAPGGDPLLTTARSEDGAILAADVGTNELGMVLFGHPAGPKMIGAGVHADLHDLVYAKGGARLFAACDGGVYRSDRPEPLVGFVAMNDGLAVIESNYVACHPVCEGYVVAGLHDNGMISRRSGAAWYQEGNGDGGGVTFDPGTPTRYVRQDHEGLWGSSDGAFRFSLPAGENSSSRCAFYSSPAAIAKHRPGAPAGKQDVTQLIFGTSRVWYTDDLGATWVTLPGATAPPPGNLDQDSFRDKITVCRWQDAEVAWVLGESRLLRYARTPGSDAGAGPGKWTCEVIADHNPKPKKNTTSVDKPMRLAAVWTDIAVNLDPPAAPGQPPRMRGTHGALYLGTIGNPDNAEVDTLWWFDGTDDWHATGLRKDGVPAPVIAVVCDPAFPDEVYVGTTIGVWKGIRTQVGDAAPAWTWHTRLNGLPEAAVEDLAIFRREGLRLLRAAISARGIWELRLDKPDVEDLAYVRAHDHDLRHLPQAVAVGRDGVTPRSWHGSPDVRPRRAPLFCPPPATLPWSESAFRIDTEMMRRFQSALRARTNDLRVRATGRWDGYFNEVLRDLGAPTVPPSGVRLDEAFWKLSVQVPHATAEPWSTPRPTHADLLDFSAELEEGVREKASCELPPGPSKIDILVHHRGLAPLDGAQVRVTLLQWMDPKTKDAARWDDSSSWPTAAVAWTEAVNEVLNSPTGATTKSLGSGWSFVGSTLATRRQDLAGQALDATHPGVATFDLDLTNVKRNAVVLLVAVIRSGTDLALQAGTLEQLAMSNPDVAVRSVQIHGFPVTSGSALSPFSARLYPPQTAASAAQNARLAAALQTVRDTLSAENKTRLDQAALIVLKLTPDGPMEYAGQRETEMFFSASLLKVSLLYATFELLLRVNVLALSITATTPVEFFDKVKRDYARKIENAVPKIPPGDWRKVAFDKILTVAPNGVDQYRVTLSADHDTDLRNVFIHQRQNEAANRCMHRLGYSYVNGALDAAGFFDASSETGIWMATDYGDWRDFHVPVATGGTSSAATTALAMANLLAYMHRGTLPGAIPDETLVNAAASATMREIFRRAGAWLLGLPNPNAFSFGEDGGKVGHSSSDSAKVGSVMSEAAFLDRKSDSAHFVAVWQNVPDELGADPVYRVLDEMIKNWP
jgi:hypothetical protein